MCMVELPGGRERERGREGGGGEGKREERREGRRENVYIITRILHN